MKKFTLLFTKLTFVLCLVIGTSGLLSAQLSANIVDLQSLIPELSEEVYPTDMIEFQGELYIGMADSHDPGASETELVRFDGTNAEIVDLGANEVGSPPYFCIYNSELYFRLFNGQLGKYDGTTCTEINLTNLHPEVANPANPGHMCAYNGELYFKINTTMPVKSPNLEAPLASYDGISNSLTVFDMNSINSNLSYSCRPNSLTVYNGLLYFGHFGDREYKFTENDYLVAFNGNATANIIPFADSDFSIGSKSYLCVYGDNLYMRTFRDEPTKTIGFSTLGVYDGVNPVSNIDLNEMNPLFNESNFPGHMALHDNMMFFKAEDVGDNKVLASYNSSSAEIHDLSLLNPSIPYDLHPAAITSYQGSLYFRGGDPFAGGGKAASALLIQLQPTAQVPINNWAVILSILLIITTIVVIRLVKR